MTSHDEKSGKESYLFTYKRAEESVLYRSAFPDDFKMMFHLDSGLWETVCVCSRSPLKVAEHETFTDCMLINFTFLLRQYFLIEKPNSFLQTGKKNVS